MEEDTKKKRFKDRLEKNKQLQEKVIKCALSKRLSEKKLMDEIQLWVEVVSKATNKGALVFNRLLLYCFENDIELPKLDNVTLYCHCFKIGKESTKKYITPVKDVYDNFFKEYPEIKTIKGYSQAITYASKTYMTNFINSLVFTFKNRQKHYFKKWCSENKCEEGSYRYIQNSVNGWGYNKERKSENKEIETFIDSQRSLLTAPDEGITFTWIKNNKEIVVKYYYHILSYMEKYDDTKKFSLAPLSSIKRHFLTIDTLVLHNLMNNCKMIKMNRKDFYEVKDEHWGSVFKIDNLTNKGQFSHMIETDGVSMCVHFKYPKKEKNVATTKKKDKRVIAIDPGRSNLIFGVEVLNDGTLKKYKLTKNHYYNESGINNANRKTAHWEKEIEEQELVYSKVSPKTSQSHQLDSFISNYVSVYDSIWATKIKKKWAQSRFRVYGLKKRVLDKFFSSMDGVVKPVIAYGAAKFSPNGKGELSSPTCALSRKCSTFYKTVMVDEYNTTKVCSDCDCCLNKVVKIVDGKVRDVRGLRWCSSTNCRVFKDRDLNASINIMRCFKTSQRPISLSHNSGFQKVIPKSLVIASVKKPDKTR